MDDIGKALMWASAIVIFALAAAADLVDEDVAQTMILVLPILAVLSLGGVRDCLPCPIARTGDKS